MLRDSSSTDLGERDVCRDDLQFINKQVDKTAIERLRQVATTPFQRVTYTEAIEILEGVVKDKKKKFEFKVQRRSKPA